MLRGYPEALQRKHAPARAPRGLPAFLRSAPAIETPSTKSCSCGGGCPRCRTNDSIPTFERDTPVTGETTPSSTDRGLGDWTLVDGFPIDNRYCFCDTQIEKELAWVNRMTDIYRECKREVPRDGDAADAVACKEQKLSELGIETESIGSVAGANDVRVDERPGPCGPILQFGVSVHEEVHRNYMSRGEPAVTRVTNRKHPKKQKEPREMSEISARDYAANEIKAYTHEARFLEHTLKALKKRCTVNDTRATDSEYYRHACGELNLEMGLDWPKGTAWGRTDVEDPWPNLKGKCWWYLGGPNGGYNCYGYALQKEEGELTVLEPGLQTLEQYDAYFAKYGYARTSGSGDIALFSKSHAAHRSEYKFAGRQLWESKLSREAPLILHELSDIEGDAFGEVMAYYTLVNRQDAE